MATRKIEALRAPESFTDLWVIHRDAAQVENEKNNTAARPHEGSAAAKDNIDIYAHTLNLYICICM